MPQRTFSDDEVRHKGEERLIPVGLELSRGGGHGGALVAVEVEVATSSAHFCALFGSH